VRDRGIVEAPVADKRRALSSLELEGRCVRTAEQSDCRQPDPELARRAEVSGARPVNSLVISKKTAATKNAATVPVKESPELE